MKSNSIIIIGSGDLGRRVGRARYRDGHAVIAVSRRRVDLPEEFGWQQADYTVPGSLDFLAGYAPDEILITLKPVTMDAVGYEQGFVVAMANLLAGLGNHRPQRIVMVSSTRVYAEQDGGWVDEVSPLADGGYAARAIIRAEQLLQTSGHCSVILRCGGIYGDPEGRLLARLARGEVCAASPLRYSNRIHREDCAAFIHHVFALPAKKLEDVYLVVDDDPAPQHEVEQFIASRLGVTSLVEQTAGRGSGHKRCRNRRLHDSGFELRYPGYREGYGAVVDARRRE